MFELIQDELDGNGNGSTVASGPTDESSETNEGSSSVTGANDRSIDEHSSDSAYKPPTASKASCYGLHLFFGAAKSVVSRTLTDFYPKMSHPIFHRSQGQRQ